MAPKYCRGCCQPRVLTPCSIAEQVFIPRSGLSLTLCRCQLCEMGSQERAPRSLPRGSHAAFEAEEAEQPESWEKERFPLWGSGEGGEGQLFRSPLSSRLAANTLVPGLRAGGQEVQSHPHPCPCPGTSEQPHSSTQVSHTETSKGLQRMNREESTRPPMALALPGLQRFRKQVASLFLLCSGPIFISFLPACVRESPEAHHKDHLFLSLPPPS